jgi:hypothetical protein
MDPKTMFKQMLDFNKRSFDNAFTAMVLLQEQTENMLNTLLEQATWLPADGKKAISEWIAMYKKGRDVYKNTVDESYKKVESFFSKSGTE